MMENQNQKNMKHEMETDAINYFGVECDLSRPRGCC